MNILQISFAIVRKDYAGAVLLILQGWKGMDKGTHLWNKLMQEANGPFGL